MAKATHPLKILVTRPDEDAKALVAALEGRGHEVLAAPMLKIAPAKGVSVPLDLEGVQAVLFTSANGVRTFARLCEARDLPVFTVGAGSAAVARAAGFARVSNADGNVDALARLVVDRLKPADGALFHAAGSVLAGDLDGALVAAGFTPRRAALYDARPVTGLPQPLRRALAEGRLDAATFFSPRTAATFVRLVEAAGLTDSCARLVAVCLSQAVAEEVGALPWREVRIAERPDQDDLLACLDDVTAAAPAEPAPAEYETEAEESMPAEPTMQSSHAEPSPEAPRRELSARRIIARFGGIRPMADRLDVPVSTVQGWRQRGAIPRARRAQILAAAKSLGIEIDYDAPTPEDEPLSPVSAPEDEPLSPAPAPEDEPLSPAPLTETSPETPPPETPPDTPLTESPAEKPEATPPPAEPAGDVFAESTRARRKTLWSVGALALVMALGAGALFLTRDASLLGPADADQETAQETAAIEASRAALTALEERVAALENTPAEFGELIAQTESLVGEIASLGARLAAMEGGEPAGGGSAESAAELADRREMLAEFGRDLAEVRAGAAASAEEVEALRARVEALADLPGGAGGGGDAAIVLAVLQLRDAVRGGGGFESELAALRDLAAADGGALAKAIVPLGGFAAAGVPDPAELRLIFPATARAIFAAAAPGKDGGWTASAWHRISNLVSIRRVDVTDGSDRSAVIARAEAGLEAGDPAAAVTALEVLDGPAAEAAKPWLDRARSRVSADRALAELGRALAARRRTGGGNADAR